MPRIEFAAHPDPAVLTVLVHDVWDLLSAAGLVPRATVRLTGDLAAVLTELLTRPTLGPHLARVPVRDRSADSAALHFRRRV